MFNIKLIRKKQMNGNDRLKYLKETIEYWIQPQHKIDKNNRNNTIIL